MRVSELLKDASIDLGAHVADKSDAISHLVDLMEKGGNLKDKEQYKKDVLAREASGTTGLGDGIATPHAKSAGVKQAGLAAMTIPEGIDFQSMDGNPARLFFAIAAPDGSNDEHLVILSKLATMIMDVDFKEALIKAQTKEEFLKLIDDKEDGKFQAAESAPVTLSKAASDHIQILAVTACPTGIAHTFMAAESLEQHAKKRGISIKVETNGSGGAKNVLTADEIAKADGIIIAADKNVAMARFDGKHVVITKVADGINKADELIDKALSGSAPIYHAKAGESAEDGGGSVENESVGRQVYKHLMNGVSHMLPFVVGGGILIAISFLLDDYSIDPSHFGSNTPVAKFFNQVGGASFGFMLPVLAGFIAMSIADRPGLAAGFAAGAAVGLDAAGFAAAVATGFALDVAVGFAEAVAAVVLGFAEASVGFAEASVGFADAAAVVVPPAFAEDCADAAVPDAPAFPEVPVPDCFRASLMALAAARPAVFAVWAASSFALSAAFLAFPPREPKRPFFSSAIWGTPFRSLKMPELYSIWK